MVPAANADYGSAMSDDTDFAALLGSALKDIRKATTGTQDRWADRTGMSQSYLSMLERGQSGWEAVKTVLGAIERAGGDPLDLFRLVLARVEGEDDQRELLALWSSPALDQVTRDGILMLLRSRAAAGAAAR